MNRRHYLAAVASSLLAGCAESDEPPPETDEPDRTETWRDRVAFDEAVEEEVYVEARKYEFDPGSDEPIRVDAGRRVGLAMTALDDGYLAGHGLRVEGHDVDLDARVGEVDSTTFVADEPGEYDVWCTVPCSDGHDRMRGTFVVR